MNRRTRARRRPDRAAVASPDIVTGLRRLGVRRGMRVMVHSSLSSFGHVEGGAPAVITALQQAVSERGTLMMPSFNHGLVMRPGEAGCFDPRRTPTFNGRIPDTFWRMRGVCRSWNPTHAFAAWGLQARGYTEHHHRTLTAGADSPLGMLWRDGGYGLFIGVGYGANTFHHVVEAVLGVPCLGRRTEVVPIRLPDGSLVEGRTWGWRARSCPINDRALYGQEMGRRGLHRQERIGSCVATLFKLSDCFDVVAELLGRGYRGYPPCSRCPIRPDDKSPHLAPSDWDEKRGALTPDSPAARY